MANVMILGPSLENVVEPEPGPIPAPGRQGVAFDTVATAPGGIVNLVLLPQVLATDQPPLNIYAFYVNPPSSVPTDATKTPDWFFKSGAPSGTIATAHAPAAIQIVVPGVKPGVYHVQTVLEYAQ